MQHYDTIIANQLGNGVILVVDCVPRSPHVGVDDAYSAWHDKLMQTIGYYEQYTIFRHAKGWRYVRVQPAAARLLDVNLPDTVQGRDVTVTLATEPRGGSRHHTLTAVLTVEAKYQYRQDGVNIGDHLLNILKRQCMLGEHVRLVNKLVSEVENAGRGVYVFDVK